MGQAPCARGMGEEDGAPAAGGHTLVLSFYQCSHGSSMRLTHSCPAQQSTGRGVIRSWVEGGAPPGHEECGGRASIGVRVGCNMALGPKELLVVLPTHRPPPR